MLLALFRVLVKTQSISTQLSSIIFPEKECWSCTYSLKWFWKKGNEACACKMYIWGNMYSLFMNETDQIKEHTIKRWTTILLHSHTSVVPKRITGNMTEMTWKFTSTKMNFHFYYIQNLFILHYIVTLLSMLAVVHHLPIARSHARPHARPLARVR